MNVNWSTPQGFFDRLNAEFSFTMDVCADPKNAKCPIYYTRDKSGLEAQWWGKAWMNPPYDHTIGKWIRKAWEESQKGCIVVCLLPAKTDTRWWHDYVMLATEIRFVKGRLCFENGDTKGRAPFPVAVVIFSGKESPTSFGSMEQ